MGIYEDARAKTRENLVSAFWEIYCEKDINRITIREITDRAGYNRATFYIYFKNVHDILDYVEACTMERIKAGSYRKKHMAAQEAMRTCIDELEESRRYLGVLLSERGDPKFSAFMHEHFRKVILQIIEDESLTPTVPLEFAVSFCIGGITHILQAWYEGSLKLSADQVINSIVTVAFAGVFEMTEGEE